MLCSPKRFALRNGCFLVLTLILTSSSPFCLGFNAFFFLAFCFGVATSAEELDCCAAPVGALEDDGVVAGWAGPFSTVPKMGIGGTTQTAAAGKAPSFEDSLELLSLS